MKKTQISEKERFNNFLAEVNEIIKDHIIKHDIVTEINNAIKTGTFVIDGNMLGVSDVTFDNHFISLLVEPFASEKGVFSKVKYIYESGKEENVTKTIEYKEYLDGCCSVTETKVLVRNGETSKCKIERFFDESGVELSKKTSLVEDKNENENHQIEEVYATYYRNEDNVLVHQQKISYEDRLNKEDKQRINYHEDNTYYYGGDAKRSKTFEKMEYEEISRDIYIRELKAINPKRLYI